MDDSKYDNLMQVILEDIKNKKPNFKEVSPHEYFYELKLNNPERYEGLDFNARTKEPFSRDLSTIFSHFKVCGFLDLDNNILFE